MSTVPTMVFWIVVGIVLVASVVLIAVEGRVMSKPVTERTSGEDRFIRSSRAVGRAQQAFARNVAPWSAVAAAVLGLVATIPLWTSGKTGVAVALTVFFVLFAVGMCAFWAKVLRHRGPDSVWRAAEDERVREADEAGRPRWFVSVAAGWGVAGMFTGLGLLFLVLALTGGGSLVAPLVVLGIGLLFMVLVGIQQRAEGRR